jgi:hypothetical protein
MRLVSRKTVGVAALLLLAAAGVGWTCRTTLLSWYYLRSLDRAGEADGAVWAERVAGLDTEAVPGLLHRLTRDDAARCAKAGLALERLVARWPADDPRGAALAGRLVESFAGLSRTGQKQVLVFACSWLKPGTAAEPQAEVASTLARLVPEAGRTQDRGVRVAGLELASLMMARDDAQAMVAPCRDLARLCLEDADGEVRARAVPLTFYPGMGLQKQLLPLLRDPEPEVRRLALLALGPAPDAITTDELLHWLHDPDPDVRRACEKALNEDRKLSKTHIRLGRLLTHPEPRVRLEVLDHLPRSRDLDPGVWLRHLSHDAMPSVRAAAIRAAATDFAGVDLRDRLEQMRQDPSPTVGQLAHYYLGQKKRQGE